MPDTRTLIVEEPDRYGRAEEVLREHGFSFERNGAAFRIWEAAWRAQVALLGRGIDCHWEGEEQSS